jgi:para-nitrobenzyl esterase
MRYLKASLPLIAAFMISSSALAAIDDPVRVEGGLISGVPGSTPEVRIFKGIPYAAPPVGALRWHAPQAVSAWKGVRQADAFSMTCTQKPHEPGSYYQIEYYREEAPTGEDCLYLNVWTAAASADERRPVMVWIHGGGFAQGSGSTPAQNGEGLAQKGVVTVTLNYRLGIFGLLAHPELTRESGHDASGNYALMDQLAALRWVRENIASFGGDPARVTVFGQSAGSQSIATLPTSPLAKGLFVRAIGESGFNMPEKTLRQAEQEGVRLAEAIGATTLAALRAKSAQELLRAADRELSLIVDGYVVSGNPYLVYASGKQIGVPVLLGSVANERGNYPQPKNLQEYLAFTKREYPRSVDDAMNAFPAANDEEVANVYLIRQRDAIAANMRRWAEAMDKSGAPAYLFYFTRKPPLRTGAKPLGAVHMTEVAFAMNVLDTIDRPWTPVDRGLADKMVSYWVNFATTGDPNGPGLARWPRYKADEVMELGDNIGPVAAPDMRELAWFRSYFAKTQGLP